MLDCFHSYIPHKVDAVIVDPGSMAKYSSTEDLRRVVHRLQALKTPPHIIFLLFHEWFGQRSRRFYELDEDNPWNRMERIALQICREIDATCISPRRELFSIVNKNHTKLLEFVGEDGLHIVNSEHGIDYVTELLIRLIDVYQSRKVDRVNPLFVHRVSAAASRCYRFGGRSPQRFRLLDWKTAPCPNCPSRNGSIPCNSDATLWRFCAWVQTKFKTKLSPSVRADIVNSTLMINLDTRLRQNPMITLQHLTSFYDAGKVNYACSSGCRCMPGRIDALNKKCSEQHFCSVLHSHDDCVLRTHHRSHSFTISYPIHTCNVNKRKKTNGCCFLSRHNRVDTTKNFMNQLDVDHAERCHKGHISKGHRAIHILF